MAYIRDHETATRRKGKPVKRYEVIWREPVRDGFGLPIPRNPAKPDGAKKMRSRQESYPTREAAQARVDELNAARHTTGASTLAEQKKAGDLPFGHYAQSWVESQSVKVATGRLKASTLAEYERQLKYYALERFGPRAIASITPHDLENWLAGLVGRGLAPKTVKHAWDALVRVLKYGVRHGALIANPADRVDWGLGRGVGDHDRFRHHPLTAEQVAAVAAEVGERYPIYELTVLFLSYSGLRSAEAAGLEVQDLTFSPGPVDPETGAASMSCTVAVRRTKHRRNRQWTTGTPKTRRSRRTVPLPGWLAQRMADYLAETHPRADEPTAPLWPGRHVGGSRHKGSLAVCELDWSHPLDFGTWYETVLKPAMEAVGLPVSKPARTAEDGTRVPAVRGVRLHDLGRHTFAVMQLSAGTHFMQVSQWLGHATYTLTLDVYGDWIPQQDGGGANLLPEPPAPAQRTQTPSNVVPFRRVN
ncbi:MAG: tyrosine-type recombinase/integrase [Mycolicibacterium sp.]|uniref:tyrosine-type recombinase/integrase n=1 Tax=Mycolicibacterium sp. TaxID=2320850 RepID=UPI003D0B9CE3